MIRKTDETPQRIYVINVAALITGKNHDAAAQDFRRMTKRYPDVSANCTDLSFAGRGQKHVTNENSQGALLTAEYTGNHD